MSRKKSRSKTFRKFNGKRFRYIQGSKNKSLLKALARNSQYRIVKGKSKVFGSIYKLYTRSKKRKK